MGSRRERRNGKGTPRPTVAETLPPAANVPRSACPLSVRHWRASVPSSYIHSRWEGKSPCRSVFTQSFLPCLSRPARTIKSLHVHKQTPGRYITSSLRKTSTLACHLQKHYRGLLPASEGPIKSPGTKVVFGGGPRWLLHMCVVGRVPPHSVPSRLRFVSVTYPPPPPHHQY